MKLHIPSVEFFYIKRKTSGKSREYSWEEINKIPSDINAVIHLAGLAHDTKNTQDNSAYDKVNYELTKYLYDWYLRSSATSFIYTSSVKAIADSVAGILTEESIARPITPYGISKLRAEEYIEQLSLGITNKSYYLLRPCMVHGPGNKGNLNLLYQFVNKGIPYPLGAFDNKRSFLSVENFCFVCKELLTRGVPSGAYNIADDVSLSTTDLVRLIGKISGKRSVVWNAPQGLVNILAKIGDALKLPLTTERLQKLTENYVVSNNKIKKALQIQSFPVTAQEGIAKTIESFKV